jgi:hypothetical protein
MESWPGTTLPAPCVLPACRLLAEWVQAGAPIQQQKSKEYFRNLQPEWLLNDCNLPFLPIDSATGAPSENRISHDRPLPWRKKDR